MMPKGGMKGMGREKHKHQAHLLRASAVYS